MSSIKPCDKCCGLGHLQDDGSYKCYRCHKTVGKADEEKKSSDVIFLKTRTGRKIHLGYRGGSCCKCGHWNKISNAHLELSFARVKYLLENSKTMHLCEKCLPSGTDAPIVKELLAN